MFNKMLIIQLFYIIFEFNVLLLQSKVRVGISPALYMSC